MAEETTSGFTNDDGALGFEVESPQGETPAPPKASEKSESAKPSEAPADTSKAATGDERSRDAQGRFVAKEGTEAAEGAPDAGDSLAQPATSEPEFEFLDRKYPTRAAAEHAWKSYLGSVRSWEEKYRTLDQEFQSLQNLVTANEKKRQLQGKAADGPQAAAQDSEKPKTFDESVDWELFDKLYNDPEYGPRDAQRWLAAKMEEYFAGKLEAVSAEKVKGVESYVEAQREFSDAVNIFNDLAERHDGHGNYIFPELREDEAFVERVARRWRGDTELYQLGARGAYLAYLDEKKWESYQIAQASGGSGNGKAGNPSSVSPSEQIRKATEASGKASESAVLTGSGTPREPGRKMSQADRIRAELLQTDESPDSAILGF